MVVTGPTVSSESLAHLLRSHLIGVACPLAHTTCAVLSWRAGTPVVVGLPNRASPYEAPRIRLLWWDGACVRTSMKRVVRLRTLGNSFPWDGPVRRRQVSVHVVLLEVFAILPDSGGSKDSRMDGANMC